MGLKNILSSRREPPEISSARIDGETYSIYFSLLSIAIMQMSLKVHIDCDFICAVWIDFEFNLKWGIEFWNREKREMKWIVGRDVVMVWKWEWLH